MKRTRPLRQVVDFTITAAVNYAATRRRAADGRGRAPARKRRGKAPWNSSSSGSPRRPLGIKIGVVAGALVAGHRAQLLRLRLPLRPVHLRDRGRSIAGPRPSRGSSTRLHREAGHRQRPEPVPARRRSCSSSGWRRRSPSCPRRRTSTSSSSSSRTGPRRPGLEIATIEPEADAVRGLLRQHPHPHDGDRQLPRDRHLLRLARPAAPHRQRQRHRHGPARRT